MHEIGWNLVISREVLDSTLFSAIVEGGCVAQRAIVSELKTAIQPVKQIERFGSEFQLPAIFCEQAARDPHVSAGVIRTDKGIAARARDRSEERRVGKECRS